MATVLISRRLSDKTLERYLELEERGELTPRQAKALASHWALVEMFERQPDPDSRPFTLAACVPLQPTAKALEVLRGQTGGAE